MSRTEKRLPKHGGITVVFHHRDTMRARHTHSKAELPGAERAVPATILPIDCTGNATVSVPIDLNQSLGDCMEAMACHVDNIWTFFRGLVGYVQSFFALPAIQSQYEAASGGDNGLDEPTLLTKCWAPGLASQTQATYDDSLDVDLTNPTLVQYCIDQFFHVCMMWSVPDAFLQNFVGGGVWAVAATPDPANGHGTPLSDIAAPGTIVSGTDIGGFYRLFTWGSWVWVSPAFIASVDPAGWVTFSRRQFNAQGYDAHGRHVTTQAAAWVALGGNAEIAAKVAAMFPAPSPAPAPPAPSPPPAPAPVPPSPVAATLTGAIAAATAALEAEAVWDQGEAVTAVTNALTAYWPRPGH
jgi:hypothetical protein